MLLSLHLTNFQRHESLRLDFGSGLHLLKGANEAGKSTLLRAAVYALFGARALLLPLAEMVTWGKPENSLKVELVFRHDGTDYTIRRSKSGAELLADGLRVSGQAEVTSFVERLLGVSATLAGKLMLASQGALQGALSDGTAVNLIESLADFDLLETIVDKIQTHYATGNTTALEQQLAAMPKEAPAEPDTAGLEQREVEMDFELDALWEVERSLTAQLTELDLTLARTVLSDAVNMRGRLADAEEAITRCNRELARPAPTPPDKTIEDFNAEFAAWHNARKVWDDYEKFLKVTEPLKQEAKPVRVGDPGLTVMEASLLRATDQRLAASKLVQQTELAIKLAEQRLITDGTCQWCQTDLTAVPEVAKHNELLVVQLAHLRESLEVANEDLAEAGRREQRFRRELEASRVAYEALKDVPEVLIEDTSIPLGFYWKSPVPTQPAPMDSRPFRNLEQQWTEYHRAEGSRESAREALSVAESNAAKLRADMANLPVQAANETLALADDLNRQLGDNRAKQDRLHAERDSIHLTLEVANARFNEAMKHWQLSQNQAQRLHDALAETRFNNHVVKRIREVRPEVAARLWAVVLQSVSQVFSAVRGTPSTVVRQGSDFLVDGHTAKSLSGSTLDSLGLAIRIGLVKTFLPSVRFLLIDEPAAGMDDQREAAMLALLSTCDLEQVIMITHSNQADAFATNITEI